MTDETPETIAINNIKAIREKYECSLADAAGIAMYLTIDQMNKNSQTIEDLKHVLNCLISEQFGKYKQMVNNS